MTSFKASRYNHFVALGDGRELAFNAMSRSLELLGPAEVDLLHQAAQGSVESAGDPRVARLSGSGFLVHEEIDELAVVRETYAALRFKSSQMTLTVMPTSSCNFGCDYCFQGINKPQEWMSKQVQAQLLAFLDRRMPQLKSLSLTWYGGEPLLAMEVIRDVMQATTKLAQRHRVNLSSLIVTNGYRLNRAIADELVELGINTVQITLDGPSELHDQRRHLLGGKGTYRRIVDNLAEAVEQTALRFSIRTNVDSRDAALVGTLLDDLAARGLSGRKNLTVYPAPVESYTEGCHTVSDFIMERQHYARVEMDFLERGRRLKLIGTPTPPLFASQCGAVKSAAFVVTPTGDLHKCWNTVNEPRERVGTLFEMDRLNEPNPTHDMWLSWTPLQDPICRQCTTLPLCAGNCTYLFTHADEMKTPDARPCPSWKYNLPQKLVMVAKDRGLIPVDQVVRHVAKPASTAALAVT